MDLDLGNRWALVTGSSSGIGAAVAQTLAREGARVIVHGLERDRAEVVAGGIRTTGAEAVCVSGDLATDEGASRVFEAASAASGGIDILVNNAGTYAALPWLETTPDSWRRFYEVDVVSAVRLVRAVVPKMRDAGWGRIINIGTGLAASPGPLMADYAAAKAALVNSTVSLAKALAGTGITVNTVSPGVIHTTGVEAILREAARKLAWGEDWATIQHNWFEQILDDKYVQRLGTPQEIADLVAFVASPLAAYINGANLRADGGLSPSIN